jgi:hypothetical protein
MALFFNATSLLAVLVVGGLYWMGLEYSYLFLYTWYDIPLHIFGGLTCGLWCMAVCSRYKLSPRRAFLFGAAVTVAVMVTWEVWEYTAGLTRGEPDYWLDTAKDLVDGSLGALAAWGLYVLIRAKS